MLNVLCGKIFNNIPESLSQKTYMLIQRFSQLVGMVIERGSQLAGRVIIYKFLVFCAVKHLRIFTRISLKSGLLELRIAL